MFFSKTFVSTRLFVLGEENALVVLTDPDLQEEPMCIILLQTEHDFNSFDTQIFVFVVSHCIFQNCGDLTQDRRMSLCSRV